MSAEEDRRSDLDALIADIEQDMRFTAEWTGRRALARRVVRALKQVAREAFVPAGETACAYHNMPLPIGHGQTISQPFIVALMTDLLEPRKDDVMLEVGTGSGYQAAVLSRLIEKLYSVEVIPDLAEKAAQRLAQLGFANVEVRTGDGSLGWSEHAPFDGIIVTAAAPSVPDALVDQLKPGRRLVIPVGPFGDQMLKRITKDERGVLTTEDILPVAFVPLTHEPIREPATEASLGEKEMADNVEIIREFIGAWSRLDANELVEYFTEDGTYYNMPAQPVSGRANLVAFIGGFLKDWAATDWEILNLIGQGDVVIAERVDRTKVGDKSVDLPCCGVFEMQDGKIKEWRDYFDMNTYVKALQA